MGGSWSMRSVVRGTLSCMVEVAFFWQLRLYAWWTRRSHQELLVEHLATARVFEEWNAAAFQLDEVTGNDLWRQDPTSRHYDYRLIYSRLQAILSASDDNDILALVNLLRSGLVRNLGDITGERLFNRAYAGTKLLIEDYITQVALAVKHVTDYPTGPGFETGLSNQAKLDLLHDTRQAFGRSVLVLQGGSIFGLCHIGVVKALHLQGLLPRIIAGTATGALIAALVGVHTEDELLEFLSSDGIDLSAFAAASERAALASRDRNRDGQPRLQHGWYATLLRRVRRFLQSGYFLDERVLADCVRANVGDVTFDEAYQRTKRVLNITVSATGGGVPTLLNYLTAPNVLIWSAALVSNASDALHAPISLQCKSATGTITPWDTFPRSPTPPSAANPDRDSPLSRIAELFNANHFIVSQARPYIAPFLAPSLHHSATSTRRSRVSLSAHLVRLLLMELQHRLAQLDSLGYLPRAIRRFLLDESVPGAALTLVPDLTAADFTRLLRNPTQRELDYWILRGERSVWPAVGALKVRCAVEVELDRGYQLVRRSKPFDVTPGLGGFGTVRVVGEKRKRKRIRAASMGGS